MTQNQPFSPWLTGTGGCRGEKMGDGNMRNSKG